tara:strand:+ start:1310 stop:2368 length:1059 start_codon:yes stop_codon:yes gene_type:complete
MFSKSLASFIKGQMKEGHDLGSIRKYLVSYGYNSKDVEDTVGSLHKGNKPINKVVMIIGIVMLIIIIVSASFLVFKPKKKVVKEDELSINLELKDKEIAAGEVLKFNLDISSTTPKNYVLKTEYRVLFKTSALTRDSKDIEFSKRSLTQESIKLPDKIKPGDYILEVKVLYGSNVESSTIGFSVEGEKPVGEEIEEEVIEEEEEEPEPIQIEEPEEVEEIIEEIHIEDFEGMTIWEKIEEIKKLSRVDSEKAEDFCKTVTQNNYKDQCFVNMAEGTKDVKYCELVEEDRTVDNCLSTVAEIIDDKSICSRVSEMRRDYCYMHFVMGGDYGVCSELKNKYLKQSCDTLSKVKN